MARGCRGGLSFLHHRAQSPPSTYCSGRHCGEENPAANSHILSEHVVNVLWVQFQIGALSCGRGRVGGDKAATCPPGARHTHALHQSQRVMKRQPGFPDVQFSCHTHGGAFWTLVRVPLSDRPWTCCADSLPPTEGLRVCPQESPHPPGQPRQPAKAPSWTSHLLRPSFFY